MTTIPLSKHMYMFSPLSMVDSILTRRWPSTAETCRHRRTNKLRYLDSCVVTDLPTLICIKHNGDDKPEYIYIYIYIYILKTDRSMYFSEEGEVEAVMNRV